MIPWDRIKRKIWDCRIKLAHWIAGDVWKEVLVIEKERRIIDLHSSLTVHSEEYISTIDLKTELARRLVNILPDYMEVRRSNRAYDGRPQIDYISTLRVLEKDR